MYASYEVAREQQADRRRHAEARRQSRDAPDASHGRRRPSAAGEALRSALTWLARPGAASAEATRG